MTMLVSSLQVEAEEAVNAKTPRRRRWWIWFLAVFLIGWAVVTAGLSSLDHNDFGFLLRYRPTVATWKPNSPLAVPKYDHKAFVYMFDKASAPQVAKAMGRELPKIGYSRAGGFGNPGETASYVRTVGKDQYGAVYLRDPGLATFFMDDKDIDRCPPGGCIVIVLRQPTWLEKKVADVKKFLHWD